MSRIADVSFCILDIWTEFVSVQEIFKLVGFKHDDSSETEIIAEFLI